MFFDIATCMYISFATTGTCIYIRVKYFVLTIHLDKYTHANIYMFCFYFSGVVLTSKRLFKALSRLPLGHAFCIVLPHRGGECVYEMRCLFVAAGLNALFLVLPHLCVYC